MRRLRVQRHEQAAGEADPSRAELYPNKRKNGARWEPDLWGELTALENAALLKKGGESTAPVSPTVARSPEAREPDYTVPCSDSKQLNRNQGQIIGHFLESTFSRSLGS